MKKLMLLSLFITFSLAANAQAPISALNENFDVTCATASFPNDGYSWSEYNPLPGTIPMGEWDCTATNGRPNSLGAATPGIQCTGVWSSSYNLDTSYFVTPELYLNGSYYPDNVYFQFDSKTTNILLGGRLALIKSSDSLPNATDTDMSIFLNPLIGSGDSSGWVTHQVNLTAYNYAPPFYLAFRYTSTTTSGTTWFLDNISLTTIPLSVPHINKEVLPLTVIGNSTVSQITLSYTAPDAATYHIVMYDMVGRKVYDGQVMAQSGKASYVINDLNLHPGMYCIKMGNENIYGTVKVIIQ